MNTIHMSCHVETPFLHVLKLFYRNSQGLLAFYEGNSNFSRWERAFDG